MSRNPPPLGDALSDEEHVLGCICDSFRAWTGTKEKNQFFQYQWSVPINRIKWKNSIHYLKKMDLSYLSIVYEIYGFNWCKLNHLNFQFKMRKNSPLVTNSYPLSGGNPILKSRNLMFRRTDSQGQLPNQSS